MMPQIYRWIAILTLGLCLAQTATAQTRREVVRFPAGFSSTVLDDSLFAGEVVEYALRASAGQRFSVALGSANPAVVFDVFLPDSVTADFISQTSGNSYSTRLRKTGDVVIRVQLDRRATQRRERADFRLTLGVTGAAVAPTPPAPVPPPPQPQPPQDISFWQVTGLRGTDTLNMRTGPGTGFRVIDALPMGTVLRDLGCAVNTQGARWCEVARTDRGARSGWVSSRYLTALGKTPVLPPKPVPTPTQSADVKCSVILPIFDRTCRAVVVFDGTIAQLTLTGPGAGTSRRVTVKDGSFSSVEREELAVQALGAQYLMVLGNSDYYLVPSTLLQRK